MDKIIKYYDEMLMSTNELVRTLSIYPKVFEDEKFHDLHKYFDKALFVTLNQVDLIIGLKYLDLSQSMGNKLEANYFSRIVILTSHEILNDLNKMVGQNIRAELTDKLGIEKMKELDKATKELNQLRKNHLAQLKDLRNNVLGHKLNHAHQQIEKIININLREIYDVGKDILNVQMSFIDSYSIILKSI